MVSMTRISELAAPPIYSSTNSYNSLYIELCKNHRGQDEPTSCNELFSMEHIGLLLYSGTPVNCIHRWIYIYVCIYTNIYTWLLHVHICILFISEYCMSLMQRSHDVICYQIIQDGQLYCSPGPVYTCMHCTFLFPPPEGPLEWYIDLYGCPHCSLLL